MTKAVTRILIIAAAVCALAMPRAASAEESVSNVRILLGVSAPEPPAAMKDKITFSVQQVVLKALQGKSISDAEEIKPELTPLLERIFNQVLGGYKVKSVDITVGGDTVVRLDIKPVGPFAGAPEVKPGFEGGVHEVWERMLAPELDEIQKKLAAALTGVPVASAGWAEKALAESIAGTLSIDKLFPGFDASPELRIAEQPVLTLRLKSRGDTVRVTNLKVRSNSIPAMALERLKFDAAARAALIVGLPVDFVSRRKDAIAAGFDEYLSESSIVKSLYLDLEVHIQPGRTTRVAVVTESQRYAGFLKGVVKLGEDTRNPDIEAHAGFLPVPKLEIFTEMNFFPGPVELQWNIGAGYRIHPKLYAAAGRNFLDGINRVWINAYLTEDIVLSWEKGVVENKKRDIEGSITFKAHEFYSFSITSDFNTDIWLAIIANL